MDPQEGVPCPSDEDISRAIRGMREIYIKSLAFENTRLSRTIELIEDGITHRGFDDWLSVRTTTNLFTDADEVDKLLEIVKEQSRFHKSKAASRAVVRELVNYLYNWWAEEIILGQNSMADTLAILKARLTENVRLLEYCLLTTTAKRTSQKEP